MKLRPNMTGFIMSKTTMLAISGPAISLTGGLTCILAGLVSIGVALFQKGEWTILTGGMHWSFGIYFIGKGVGLLGNAMDGCSKFIPTSTTQL